MAGPNPYIPLMGCPRPAKTVRPQGKRTPPSLTSSNNPRVLFSRALGVWVPRLSVTGCTGVCTRLPAECMPGTLFLLPKNYNMNRTPFQTLLSQRILDDPSAASAARPCSFTFAARSRRPVGAHGSSTRVYCLRRGPASAKLLVVSMCSVRYTTFSIIFPGTVG